MRRTAPGELPALHAAAARWLAGHGHPAEAVRQAQAAEDWPMATRLLADHWLDLYLGGRGATLAGLLDRFPGQVVAASPELTAVQVAADLVRGALNRQARRRPTSVPGEPQRLREPLSESELRVLRYLPTNLTVQRIANELYVSVNTVKAHARHLYAKLGVHSRGEAVEQARALRLLAPSPRPRDTEAWS